MISPATSLSVRQPGLVRREISRSGWWWSTEWLLAAVVFLLPWQARWIYQPRQLNGAFWEYGSFSLYAVEVVIWACLGTAAAQIIFFRQNSWSRFRWQQFFTPAGAVVAGTIGLVVLAWSSLAWAADRGLTLQAAFRLTEAAALMVVVLTVSPRGRGRVGQAWAVAAALQGALAAVQFFAQRVIGSSWLGVDPQRPEELGASVIELADGRWLRAYGTFPHPNILAGFLGLGLLLAGAWYVREYRLVQRLAAVSCGVLAGIGLALTFSRAGATAAVVGFLAWLAFDLGQRRRVIPHLRYAALITLAAAAAAVWTLPQVMMRAGSSGRLEVKSVDVRRALRREGAQLAQPQRWIGTGVGLSTLASFRRDPWQAGFAYQPPHNVPLLVLVELSVDGVLLLALLIVGVAAQAVASQSGVGLGLVAALAVVGWFDHYLWTLLPGTSILFLALGFAAAGDSVSSEA